MIDRVMTAFQDWLENTLTRLAVWRWSRHWNDRAAYRNKVNNTPWGKS